MLLLLIELAAVDPLFNDRLLNVECRVLPRSPRDGEVAEDTDPGPAPPPFILPVFVGDATEAAVPGGLILLLLIAPASALVAWAGGDRIFDAGVG